MRREPRVLLHDVAEAIGKVRRFTGGRSIDDYRGDELLRSAVERQLAIIGEALSQLRSTDPRTTSGIRDIDRIVAFRHVLVHGYGTVDDLLVWGVIEGSLAALGDDVSAALAVRDGRRC